MKRLLAGNWFLLALALTGTAAFVAPEWTRPLVGWLPARIAVVLMLFTATLTLESQRLWASLARPGPALLAVALSYGLMPALAALVERVDLPLALQLGLCIVAAVPCTMSAATIWTRLAGGNEAIALLVTLITTSTSWLITTAWLTVLTGRTVQLDPLQMMLELAFALILPVAFAQLLRLHGSIRAFADRRRAPLGVFAQLVILIMVTQALVVAAEHLRESAATVGLEALGVVAAVCLGGHLLVAVSGFALARGMRIARTDAIAVAIAGSQKTLPVGLLIINGFFADHPLTVVPLVFYHVGGLIIDTILARVFQRRAVTAGGTGRTSPTGADAL